MPFEVRPENPAGPFGEDPRASVFSDDEWRRLLALARRHGFDPQGEYGELLNPSPGESANLVLAAAQELAVALSAALREETDPGARGESGILVGPSDEPDLQISWARVRSLGEIAESGPVTIDRLQER